MLLLIERISETSRQDAHTGWLSQPLNLRLFVWCFDALLVSVAEAD